MNTDRRLGEIERRLERIERDVFADKQPSVECKHEWAKFEHPSEFCTKCSTERYRAEPPKPSAGCEHEWKFELRLEDGTTMYTCKCGMNKTDYTTRYAKGVTGLTQHEIDRVNKPSAKKVLNGVKWEYPDPPHPDTVTSAGTLEDKIADLLNIGSTLTRAQVIRKLISIIRQHPQGSPDTVTISRDVVEELCKEIELLQYIYKDSSENLLHRNDSTIFNKKELLCALRTALSTEGGKNG